jgi:branched-chain amino acid transport system permease protein
MMIEDVIKFIWGTSPQTTGGIDLIYGRLDLFGATVPVYNLVVILCSLIIAALIGYLLLNTRFGRIIRATAEKKEMGEALGINMKMVYIKVFTLGTVLGTLGGALVIPATAVVSEMGVELIVMAFAVVVIGGLGSMKGAFIGALIVGVLKSIAISTYPELEMLTIYIIVIAVLVIKPQGLFGGSKA